jgi:hypothetical protein
MSNFNISVLDSVNLTPIVGATIFVNGVSQTTTDITGQASVTITQTSFTLTVSSIGYNNQVIPNVTSGATYVFLVSAAPLSSSFILNVNPESPAIGQTFIFDNNGSPVNVSYTPGGITVPNLTVGTQTITANITGYQPVNTVITTPFQTQTTIELAATVDSGMAIVKSPQSISPITTTVNTLPTLTSPTNPEFVPPNVNQGSYFTMTQARLYIGRIFIDELNGIQFTLQNNKIPIYGYASRDFDAIAQGKSLVQGQFTINFISEGYLYVTLQDYINSGSNGTSTPTVSDGNQSQLNSLITKLQNPDPQWTPEMVANAAGSINNLIANMGNDALTSAKTAMKNAQNANSNNVLGLAGGDYPNAVYQNIGFDIILTFSGAGRTVTRRIENCRLISNESIMDHSGTPILDSYGFIGRRLR